MISANELRIGNFFLYAPNEKITRICRVFAIDDKCITAFDNKLPIAVYKQESRKGIPLTPEILEKCGFLNTRGFYVIGSDLISFIFNDGKLQLTFVFGDTKFRQVNHLHDLQNLYFALTNEELLNYENNLFLPFTFTPRQVLCRTG